MKNNNNNRQQQYISSRIEQLKEDKKKASNPHDKAWYNRLIQELDWAEQMSVSNKRATHNCYMEKEKVAI